MRTIVVGLLILSLSSFVYSQNWIKKLIEPSEEFSNIQAAGKLLQEGKGNACLKALQSAVAKDSDLPPAEFLLGVMLIDLKNQSSAKKTFQAVGFKYPDYPGNYVILANTALSEQRDFEAHTMYLKALSTLKNGEFQRYQKEAFLEQIYTGMAALAERRKDWKKLADYFEKLLRLRGGKDGLLQQRIAISKFRAGISEDNDLYRELKLAKTNNDKLEIAEMTIGKLYHEKGNKAKAKEWMKKAAKNYAKNGDIRLQVAMWLLKNNMEKGAKYEALQAKKLGVEHDGLKNLLGLLARYEKDYEEAEAIFNEMHQKNPTSFNASNQLALALIEQEDKAKKSKALQLAQINAKLMSKNANALTTLGWIYYKLNQVEASEKIFTQALKLGNPSAEAAYYLAHLNFKQNRLAATKKWLQLASGTKAFFVHRDEVDKWLERLGEIPE